MTSYSDIQVLKDGNSQPFLQYREGSRWRSCVMMGTPIKLVKLPIDDDYAPALLRGSLYPIERASRMFLLAGKRLGITEGATRQLRELLKGGNHE